MFVSTHGDGADLIAPLANLFRQACVLATEEQDIALFKTEAAEALALVAAATDESVRLWQNGFKRCEVLMGADIHVRPVIQAGTLQRFVVDFETERLDQ